MKCICNYLTTKIVLVITNLCQIPPPIFFLCYDCCDEREITLIPCKEQPSINVWETHANLHTWNCFACCELSDWPKRVITVFIILLYIHEVRSLACDTEQDFLRVPMTQHIAKNRASEKSEFKSNALSKRLVCSYFSLVN